MSQLSCDIIRDLLSGYLDGICSDESKKIVEQHLQECQECRNFYENMQRCEESEKENLAIDYFRRIKRDENRKASMVFYISLLIFIPIMIIWKRTYGMVLLKVYYIELPILIFTSFIAVSNNRAKLKSSKLEVVLKGISIIIIAYMSIIEIAMIRWNADYLQNGIYQNVFGMEPQQIGPLLQFQDGIIVIVEIIVFAILFLQEKRKSEQFLFGHMFCLLGMNMALTFESVLHNLEDPYMLQEILTQNALILVIEAFAMTGSCCLIRRKNFKIS